MQLVKTPGPCRANSLCELDQTMTLAHEPSLVPSLWGDDMRESLVRSCMRENTPLARTLWPWGVAMAVEFDYTSSIPIASLRKPNVVLKKEQQTSIRHIYNGEDVILWLLTGFGKRLCYRLEVVNNLLLPWWVVFHRWLEYCAQVVCLACQVVTLPYR